MFPFMINNVLQSQSHIFHSWPEGICWSIKKTTLNAASQIWHRTQAFDSRYCPSGNPRTKSHRRWHLANEEAMLLENDGWSSVHLWNAVLTFHSFALNDDLCKDVHHPARKWYLQSIHAIEVVRLINLSTYHGTVVPWQNRFGYHLQLS